MEEQVKKLRTARQELINTLSSGLKFGKNNVKSESDILQEMDNIIDEMENLLDYDIENKLKELEHHKNNTIGLYATDKEPEKLFE